MNRLRHSKHKFKSWFELMKFWLSLTVAISSLAGYFLYKHALSIDIIFLLVGIMLLASAVAIINQCQEHATDALMPRTCNRPLPSGKTNPGLALLIAIILLLLGTGVLWVKTNIIVALLGLINATWYNLVYTPLKRITAFAVIPGSVCGAIPPLMGWVAAGGNLWHPKIMLLVFFFFIWQIPHFWLIIIKYGKEYTLAGLPSLTKIFSRDKLRNLTFVWLVAGGVAALFLPVFSMVLLDEIKYAIVVLVVLFYVFGFWALYKSYSFINYKMAFTVVNLFMLCVVLLIIADSILRY